VHTVSKLELTLETLEATCPLDQRFDQESFVAIDVETANSNISSICQIATVCFLAGQIVESWQSVIDPEEPFAPLNVMIHGIDGRATQQAPSFPMIMTKLSSLLTDKIVVSHMAFDRVAIQKVCLKYDLQPMSCVWLDTARVARRAWPRFSKRGYGLRSIASWCEIEFHHHNALADASTAGQILTRAVAETGIGVKDWIAFTGTRVCRSPSSENKAGIR